MTYNPQIYPVPLPDNLKLEVDNLCGYINKFDKKPDSL